jgi:class 3 adenylate cyclase
LREHRAAADPLTAQHGGRIVKTTGDGVLIEFGSVVGSSNATGTGPVDSPPLALRWSSVMQRKSFLSEQSERFKETARKLGAGELEKR